MKLNYKKLSPYIRVVNKRNKKLEVNLLLGVSIQKIFIPSIANTVGTDMSKYKIIYNKQFAYGPVTSRNGDKISVALLEEEETAIVSQSYVVFEIIDHEVLDPEYLMMWFRRPEFDRYARFKSHGSTRETFDWDEMCELELPIPSIEKQCEIVKEYNTIVNRISLNKELNQKLEETAQALYKHWFVDFEFPNEDGKPYKSSGGKMVYNGTLDADIPSIWIDTKLEDMIQIRYGKDHKLLKDGNIPLYGSGGVMRYVEKHLYDKQSILIPRKGSLNNILFINKPFWSVDTMFYSEIINPDTAMYVFYFLKRIDFYALDTGSAVPSTTTNHLNAVPIALPSESLVKKFNDLVQELLNMLELKKSENLTLQKLAGTVSSKMSAIYFFEKEKSA